MSKLRHSLVRVVPGRVAARYDNAQTTNDNKRHWANADSLSADAANNPGVRRLLRNRSRYEVANNGYAAGMVRTIENAVIGTGPRLRMLLEDQNLNAQIDSLWRRWALRCNLATKLHTACRSKVVDGEPFILLTNNRKFGRIQLDIRPIEADLCSTPGLLMPVGPGAIDGIEFDEDGNPEWYNILPQHPGDGSFVTLADPIRWPARNVIHVYREDRAGQRRGIPETQSSLGLWAQLRRYTLAVLTAAETAANIALAIETSAAPYSDDDEAASLEVLDTIELERGVATTLPSGAKLSQVKAEQPTTTYKEFKDEIIGEAARPHAIPRNVALANSAGYNYSSGRLDYQAWCTEVDIERELYWESRCLDPILNAFLAEACRVVPELEPLVAILNEDGDLSHSWEWDAPAPIDEEKRENARKTRIETGLTSYSTEFAIDGRSCESEWSQMAKDLGITLDEYREKRLSALFEKSSPQPAPAAPDDQTDDSNDTGDPPSEE